jgi:hypothetical protein
MRIYDENMFVTLMSVQRVHHQMPHVLHLFRSSLVDKHATPSFIPPAEPDPRFPCCQSGQ